MSWKNNKKISELFDKIFTNKRVGHIYAANSILCAVSGAISEDELSWVMAILSFIIAVVFWHAAENE